MLSANFRNTPVEEVHLPSQPGRHSLSNYPSAIQDHTTIQRGTSANAPHLEVCEQQRHYQQAEDHASLVGQQRRRSSTLTPKTAECFAAQNAAGSARDHVRRRITRACDQCNQLRTKCDGKHPCGHCLGSSRLGKVLYRNTDMLQSPVLGASTFVSKKSEAKLAGKIR